MAAEYESKLVESKTATRVAENEITRLNGDLDRLAGDNDQLNQEIERVTLLLQEAQEVHGLQIEQLRFAHQSELDELKLNMDDAKNLYEQRLEQVQTHLKEEREKSE